MTKQHETKDLKIRQRALAVQKVADPIIMLTARDEEADKIRGLDTGADDYIIRTVRSAGYSLDEEG